MEKQEHYVFQPSKFYRRLEFIPIRSIKSACDKATWRLAFTEDGNKNNILKRKKYIEML